MASKKGKGSNNPYDDINPFGAGCLGVLLLIFVVGTIVNVLV